jgi:ABC-type dipeptide/oligopeptide/nickel transport system ATPase component
MLAVEQLAVAIVDRRVEHRILKGISFSIGTGEMHGLVGETGSGKSMTARAITGLLPAGGSVTAGRIRIAGRDVVGLGERELREIRGPVVGMIFQNPRTALHPLLSVEKQMTNVIRAHRSLARRECRELVREHLAMVGIADPNRVARAYPHELSGGMAQRVVIATVLVSRPSFLIADEPTTGLDATVQRQILEEIAGLQQRLNLSVLMITHDLAIVSQYCDAVSVMHEGLIVEQGTKREIMLAPTHPYTQRLIQASRLEGIRDEQGTAA